MKRIIALFLSIVMLVSSMPLQVFSLGVDAREPAKEEKSDPIFDDKGFAYNILTDGTAEICGYQGESVKHLTVPEEIDGLKVTQLAQEAFAHNETLETIFIPETVQTIGNSAFYHCSALRAIAFEGETLNLGFTVAEGSKALEKIFCLKNSDLSLFCSILVSDIGQDEALDVEILEFGDKSALQTAYWEYMKEAPVQSEDSSTDEGEKDVIAEGSLGNSIVWKLEPDGRLSIDGLGDMSDFKSEKSPWYSHRTDITSVVVGDGITRICNYAFWNCSNLESVEIPRSVTEIGAYAFVGCAELEKVCYGGTREQWEDGAVSFGHGWNLGMVGCVVECADGNCTVADNNDVDYTDIAYSEGLAFISNGDGTCTLIGKGTCADTAIVIPPTYNGEAVTAIGDEAFYYIPDVTSIVIPDGVEIIGRWAFDYCHDLIIIEFPNSITEIGVDALSNCPNLTDVYYHGTKTEWESISTESGIETLSARIHFDLGADHTHKLYETVELPEPLENYTAENGHYGDEEFIIEDGLLYNNDLWVDSRYKITALRDFTLNLQYAIWEDDEGDEYVESCHLTILHNGRTTFYFDDLVYRFVQGDVQISLQEGDTVEIELHLFKPHEHVGIKLLPPATSTTEDRLIEATEEVLSSLQPLCTEDICCAECDAVLIEKTDHTPGEEATCTAAQICMICNEEVTPKLAHTPGEEATCETSQICTVCKAELTPAFGHKVLVQSGFYSAMNDTHYPFVMEDGVLVSTNHDGGSSSSYTISATRAFTLELEYRVSSESSWDHLYIYHNSTEMVKVSGSTSWSTLSIDLQEGDTVTIRYSKDQSVSKGNDCGYVKFPSVLIDATEENLAENYTCDETVYCELCGKFLKEATEHTLGEEATCTAAQICTICNEEVVPKLAHMPGEWEIVTPATTKQEGLKTSTCTVCGETFSEAIPKISRLDYTVNADGVTCTITGLGTITESDVVVPSTIDGYTVTVIGREAFYDCDSLTSISIPDSVIAIEYGAFRYCDWLETVTLGSGLKTIEDYAFYDCDLLENIQIPESVTSIGDYAFWYCKSLYEITIAANNQNYCSVDGVLFDKSVDTLIFCPRGKSAAVYTIPDSVTVIKSNAFRDCVGLVSVVIPDGVTEIDDYTFTFCEGLTSITIGSGVKSVGYNTFGYCSNLTDVYYKGTKIGWEKIQIDPYNNDVFTSAQIHYDLGPDHVHKLYETVELPEPLENYTAENGYYGDGPEEFIIEDGILSNGDFWSDSRYKITALRDFTLNLQYMLSDDGDEFMEGDLTIYHNDMRMLSAYNECEWTDYRIFLQEGDTVRFEYWTGNLTDRVYIKLLSPATSITEDRLIEATEGVLSSMQPLCDEDICCVECDAVLIEKTGHTLGEEAACKVQICIVCNEEVAPKLAHTPGEWEIVTPATTKQEGLKTSTCTVCGETFSETIPKIPGLDYTVNADGVTCTVTGIGTLTSEDGSYYFGSLVIPNEIDGYTVTAIAEDAFVGCGNLTSIKIPDSVTIIGDYAFADCYSLTSVEMGDSLTQIGDYAFAWCLHLQTVTLGNGLKTIGSYAFYHCDYLFEIVIPDSVMEIGSYAFANCFLEVVTLGSGVTSISEYAFSANGLLFWIYFNGTTTDWTNGTISFADSWDSSTGPYIVYCTDGTVSKSGEITKDEPEITYSEGLSFTSNGDGTCTLTGIGTCTDTDIVIPPTYNGEAVTAIGGEAFSYLGDLMSVTIPDSVTSIGWWAFGGCSGLVSITIPDSVTSIGWWAFGGCSGLVSITIPDSVTSIGEGAFYSCDGLTSVTIGSGVQSIGNDAFYNCKRLATITVDENNQNYYSIDGVLFDKSAEILIFYPHGKTATEYVVPDSVTSIGEDAFYGCDGLTSVTIGSGVTSIGNSAFYGCSGLTSVIIPDSVREIGEYAFSECEALESVTLGSGLEKIGSFSFAWNRNLVSINIPDGVKEIGEKTFYSCGRLTSMIIPDSVTSIGDSAFCLCSGMTSVTIGSGVTSIGNYAFEYCSGLTSMIIPDSVTSIGNGVFRSCTGLTTIVVAENNQEYRSIEGVLFDQSTTLLLAYPAEKTETAYEIPDSVKEIGAYAFAGCKTLESVTLGNNVETIGSGAFSGCASLHEIVVDGNNTNYRSIEGVLFDQSATLLLAYPAGKAETAYEIPDSVKEIGEYAFYDCDGLTSVTIGSGVETIGSYAFNSCSGLVNIEIPDGVKTIGEFAFSGSKLASIEIPDSVETIGSSAFTYCLGLTSVVIGSGVKSIGSTVFSLCSRLKEMTFRGTTVPSGKAFVRNMTALETVYVPLESYEDYVSAYSESVNQNVRFIAFSDKSVENFAISQLHDKTIVLSWSAFTDLEVVGYIIKRNGVEIADVSGLTYTDGDLEVEKKYTYTIVGYTEDGTRTSESRLTVFSGDYGVPEKIINVIAVGDVDKIHINWSIATEIGTHYHIYRRSDDSEVFEKIADIFDRNTLAYVDCDVQADKIYYYYVVGVNGFGQEGEPSDITVSNLIVDEEAPVVTKLQPANGQFLTGTVVLGVTAQDNFLVAKTELYYSLDDGETWTLLMDSDDAVLENVFDTTALPDGKIKIKGVAYDSVGNESDPLIYVFYIDNTGPEQVQGVEYESTSVTVTLSWNDVSDNDISYYRVEIKNSDGSYTTLTDIRNTLGANIYGLIPDTSYTYRIVGYDINGNRGIASEDITAVTASDTTAPVISRITPLSGYYSDKIMLSFMVQDEYNVSSILIRVSTDGSTWTEIDSVVYENISSSRVLSYDLHLDEYEEGDIYVQAIATDSAGNESVSGSSAPFVQHIIDRTAPEEPKNVTATGYNGYIEIAWEQGSENDLDHYFVYRAEEENGDYVLLNGKVKALNLFDRNTEPEKTYYYKVAVCDFAGNESEYSEPVSATVALDTESPVIHSIYPASGSQVGASLKTVSVMVSDNNELASVLIQYSKDGNVYHTLKSVSDIHSYNTTVSAELDSSDWQHGDSVWIRVTVTDISGNTTISDAVEYTVDLEAPTVGAITSSFEHNSVHLVWIGNEEEDLSGYRIYRKVKGSESYQLIAQRQSVENQTAYMVSDSSVAAEAVTYVYKIEAIDKCGNSSFVESEISLADRSMPNAVISCEPVLEVGVEYYIDASLSTDNSAIVSYHFDFGDGTASTDRKVIHKYAESGTYTITLTVTDDNGNVSVCTKEISVKERTLLGSIKIQVKDEDGKAVPNAAVYFDLGEETQVIKYTDKQGYVSFTAEVGKHTVGCIIANNEWLPAKKEVVVTAGEETTVTMTMVHHVMVEGSFDVQRMTFEEIIAAGIDVTDPENQYFVRVTVYLNYKQTIKKTEILWNVSNNEQLADPFIEGDTMYIPRVLKPVYNNNSGSAGDEDDSYHFSEDVSVAMFEIPVDVSSLKEFFDVRLHIINNASAEFSMLENVITLDVPDGLTLMDTHISEKNSVVEIAEIKGQTTETIRWILRGDEVGEYYLSADYSGILSQFNAPVYTEFVAESPLKVYGLSNLKLLVEVAETLDHATLYYNVALLNQGTQDVYLPHINTNDTLIEIELLDERGRDFLEKAGLTAKDFILEDGEKKTIEDWVTSLSSDVGVLKAGYALRKHYMCIDQSSYSEKEYELDEYWYNMQNSYGLEVEIIPKPMSYFKDYLNSEINSTEKAYNALYTNKGVYEYIMNNDNFMYWDFYSSNGALKDELPSDAEVALWELMKFDFVELITDEESEELITAIILDTMELSVEENSEYALYTKAGKFLELILEFLQDNDLANDVLGDIEYELGDRWAKVAEHLPSCFLLISETTRWEFYKAVNGTYGDSNEFFYTQWVKYLSIEHIEIHIEETEFSKVMHQIFSHDCFETVWSGLEMAPGIIKDILKVSENTEMDMALFIAAQSNLDNCNLFLDALIACVPASDEARDTWLENVAETLLIMNYPWFGIPAQIINQTHAQLIYGDADQVLKCAIEIKKQINDGSCLRKFLDNLIENEFEKLDKFVEDAVGETVEDVLKKAGIIGSAWFTALKVALEIITFVGDNVFNVSDRHDIADNIRYISIMTIAMQEAIRSTEKQYKEISSSENAQCFMQLLYYMINLRAIGESQVAELGVTYDVLPVPPLTEGGKNPFTGQELFEKVCEISGITDVESWYEWRDRVEDDLSLKRVRLFKNPVVTKITGLNAPVITFDYRTGQTVQSFHEQYICYIGEQGMLGDGGPLRVEPSPHDVELAVVIFDGSEQHSQWSFYTVHGIPSLMGSGIVAVENSFGYLISGLDNDKTYEVTFSKTKMDYDYGDSLSMQIPAGSYSFLYQTEEEYEYIYIRSLADENAFASYILESAIINYQSECTVDTSIGKISDIKGTKGVSELKEYCDKISESVTITAPDGEETDKLGTGYVLTVDGVDYDVVVTADVNGDAEIDVFDLFAMLSHVNSEEELSGLFFEAGCVLGNEEIDIFDIFSTLSYMNTGEFSE